MTHIYNNPDNFAAEVLNGYASAYARYVSAVPAAGVVNARAQRGLTRVVVGGGGGHFPWSAGFVGPGMADGAVMGNVFTSPSAEQIYQVIRALPDAASVLFCYGNYAGDVLHFNMAQERLRSEGVDCRSVQVTDDVASAASGSEGQRRGIAGSMIVYKIAGAAAAAGGDIGNVERAAGRANERTRTFGVAFSACTFPGREKPHFDVAPGTFELGLGIHGEPGVRSAARMSAAELAGTLVGELVKERPSDASGRAAILLNGLGATSQDELLVLWSGIAPLLKDAGIDPVLPEVGEYVTSLDMAGCSLSLCWLDDELEDLWLAPVDTPAFRRGSPVVASAETDASSAGKPVANAPRATKGPSVSSSDDAGSDAVRASLAAMLDAVTKAEAMLGEMDSVAGDGDHGVGMTRGLRAAVDAARTSGRTPELLRAAGAAWSDRGAGTSGALWGLLLSSMGDALDAKTVIDGAALSKAIAHAARQVQQVGKAEIGDKTMVDALAPFVESLLDAMGKGTPLGAAWPQASALATERAQATASLRPRLGRARPLAERSVGSPDPGAVSMALCLSAVAPVLKDCN
ncbi:MAG: dihydroxyacetone kinase family protein [Rhizobiaceae bacterium]|nr:dihydroxyacetone kinase family protein [Rhizobiaceae bacterium]